MSAEACGTLSVTPAPPCTITPPDQLCVGTIVTFVGPAGDFTVIRDPGGANLALWQKA